MNPLENKYINIYSRILTVLLFATIGACASPGAIPDAIQHDREEQIESKLIRGTSTKADVLKGFGKRNGSGTGLIPGDPMIREMWYYEDVKYSGSEANQKILLIYFKDDIYDGYMWFTNKSEIKRQK